MNIELVKAIAAGAIAFHQESFGLPHNAHLMDVACEALDNSLVFPSLEFSHIKEEIAAAFRIYAQTPDANWVIFEDFMMAYATFTDMDFDPEELGTFRFYVQEALSSARQLILKRG